MGILNRASVARLPSKVTATLLPERCDPHQGGESEPATKRRNLQGGGVQHLADDDGRWQAGRLAEGAVRVRNTGTL